ncbi:MAG: MerR family transcriptional regulator [Anaerolineae bacterium]|nr:MerR family transcriptional regulator [Anaerolineae bacterium]
MDTLLTIQQVADKTGLSEHTLRYYERIGLIESIDRADNGHRRYSDVDVGWIEFLKCLRATGMPVMQMKAYADLTRVGDHTIEARLELLKEHRRAVLAQIEEMQAYLSVVDYKIDYYTKEKERIETCSEN